MHEPDLGVSRLGRPKVLRVELRRNPNPHRLSHHPMWLVAACAPLPDPPPAPREPPGLPMIGDPPERDSNFGACGCGVYHCDFRHLGTDWPMPIGTPVYPVESGEVLAVAGPDQEAGWGRYNYGLLVLHGTPEDGEYIAVYGHLRTEVQVGDRVTRDRPLGTIGEYYRSSPRATWCTGSPTCTSASTLDRCRRTEASGGCTTKTALTRTACADSCRPCRSCGSAAYDVELPPR